jgi:hypothetical protein
LIEVLVAEEGWNQNMSQNIYHFKSFFDPKTI